MYQNQKNHNQNQLYCQVGISTETLNHMFFIVCGQFIQTHTAGLKVSSISGHRLSSDKEEIPHREEFSQIQKHEVHILLLEAAVALQSVDPFLNTVILVLMIRSTA